jgi:hypothetical protein
MGEMTADRPDCPVKRSAIAKINTEKQRIRVVNMSTLLQAEKKEWIPNFNKNCYFKPSILSVSHLKKQAIFWTVAEIRIKSMALA